MIGKSISHYRILEQLGQGGMGVVYRAEDTRLRRQVALKFLPGELSRDPGSKARFLREARAVSQLQHPNICAIHDIDESSEGQLFLSMDCYEGETLQQRLVGGPLAIEDAVELALQIASGLAHAHARGVVHRDLKPGNVMITAEGEVKILDFGLAKAGDETRMTREGTILGTACYMSPEQAHGADVDHRSDLWSLGVVLYEMLAGRSPFQGGQTAAVIHRILSDDPVPLNMHRSDVPESLDRLVAALLTRNANDRCQSAEECIEALRELQGGEGSAAGGSIPTRAINQMRAPRRRRFFIWGAVTAFSLAAALFIGLRWSGSGSEPPSGAMRLAVMLFRSLGDPGDLEHLAAGISEDMRVNLYGVDGLTVLSRSAVERYRDQAIDPRELRNDLHCDYVLEGSVRVVADSLRINAQLVDARDAVQVWARTYGGSMASIFALQDSIQAQVVGALGLTGEGVEAPIVSRRWTKNVEAYAYYVSAREITRTEYDPSGWPMVTALYDKALALDPFYVPAMAELAIWLVAEEGVFGRYTPGRHERAIRLAETATQLDPNSAQAWRAVALTMQHFDTDVALSAARKAIDANPAYPEGYRTLAHVLSLRGRYEEAEEEYRRFADIDPYSAYPFARLARMLRGIGEYERAEATVEQGLLRLPGDPFLRWNQAAVWFDMGETDKAIVENEAILAENPDHWDSYWALGTLYQLEHRYAEADSIFTLVVERWPSFARGLDRAGTHFLSRRDLARAEQLFRQAIDAELYALLARYHLARTLDIQGRKDEAAGEIKEIARIWPRDPAAALYLGHYYRYAARDNEQAESWYLLGRSIAREDKRLRDALASLYRSQSRYSDAAELHEESVELNPRDHESFMSLAECYLGTGDHEAALAAAQSAVELDPEFCDGWMTLGDAYLATDKRYQALASYERAADCYPESNQWKALNSMGSVEMLDGRWRRAAAHYRQGLGINPDQPGIWNALANCEWYNLDDEVKGREVATEMIERALNRPNVAFGLEILGTIEQEAGNHAAADSLFDRSGALLAEQRERLPNHPWAYGYGAQVHARRGQEEEARALVERLMEVQPESMMAHRYCVAVFTLLGDLDTAFAHLETAFDLGYDLFAELDVDRDLRALRADPRYEDLVGPLR